MSWSADAGQDIELNSAEAKRLINAGYATEVAIISRGNENAAKQTRPPKGRRKEKNNGKLSN